MQTSPLPDRCHHYQQVEIGALELLPPQKRTAPRHRPLCNGMNLKVSATCGGCDSSTSASVPRPPRAHAATHAHAIEGRNRGSFSLFVWRELLREALSRSNHWAGLQTGPPGAAIRVRFQGARAGPGGNGAETPPVARGENGGHGCRHTCPLSSILRPFCP